MLPATRSVSAVPPLRSAAPEPQSPLAASTAADGTGLALRREPPPGLRPFLPTRNLLLGALPDIEYAQLAPHLVRVTLRSGDVLAGAGAPLARVYFPESALVVVQLEVAGRRMPADLVAAGRDGVVGLPGSLGREERIVVRIGGDAMALPADTFRAALLALPGLRPVLDRYTYGLLLKTALAGRCARVHELEPRLATLLLETQERLGSERIRLTHLELSAMLGVRRAGITDALARLRATGAVQAGRATIAIADRERLAAAACGCHAPRRDHHLPGGAG